MNEYFQISKVPTVPDEKLGGGRFKDTRPRLTLNALTIGSVTSRNPMMYYRAIGFFAATLTVGWVSVTRSEPSFAWPFAMIALASMLPLVVWAAQPIKGSPMLPGFALQQTMIYLMPLFRTNETIMNYPTEVMHTSSVAVALFLLLLPLGWFWGRKSTVARPSRWNLELRGAGGMSAVTMRIALVFLGSSIAFELLFKLGWMGWFPAGLSPVLRALLSALAAFGAFLGGFVVSRRGRGLNAGYYWTSFFCLFFLASSEFLLSSVTLMVVASVMGQLLGSGKIPWKFVVAVGSILAFLNVAKFDMRSKYWGEDSAGRSLSDLPAIYAEWSLATLDKLMMTGTGDPGIAAAEDNGQSLLDRMNNLQNILFVVNAQQTLEKPPMWGETYALIPPLLIPRILWPGKPRTHEGQVRLNLHYGRQASVEQTETTYIAWGLLPEAAGNYGPILGAAILGPVIGLIIGMLESWSARKRLFSIEGLLSIGLLLQLLVSFEMVASVFLTSTFQMLMVLSVGAIVLRTVLLRQGSALPRKKLLVNRRS